jgi:hypothetical protein
LLAVQAGAAPAETGLGIHEYRGSWNGVTLLHMKGKACGL